MSDSQLEDAKEIARKAGRIEILEELTDDWQVGWTYVDISKWINEKLAE